MQRETRDSFTCAFINVILYQGFRYLDDSVLYDSESVSALILSAQTLVPGLQRDASETFAFIKCSLLISFRELNMDEKSVTTAWRKDSIYLCIFIASSFMQQHLSFRENITYFPKSPNVQMYIIFPIIYLSASLVNYLPR